MLRKLIHLSLRFHGLVAILAALTIALGVYQTIRSSLDVFPDFVPPQITIQTEVPGLAPEEVEKLITFPIEAAVSGISGLDSVRSESIQGLSVVTVTFADSTDILVDRQLLAERMTEVTGNLPAGTKAPALSPLVSSTMDLLKIGLTSDTTSPMDLRSLADWQMKPLLLAVPGVADVTVVGGDVRQIQIKTNPQRLAERHVTLTEVITATAEATGVRGAGYLETVNQRLLLTTSGQFSDPDILGKTLIRGRGSDAIRLSDVADVQVAPAPKFGEAVVMGKPGVLLALTSQYGSNTLEVTRRVESALASFQPALDQQNIQLHHGLHRPANFIETALGHIQHSLLVGAILVIIVLLVFLRSPRTAFISFLSIPLSLLSAVMVFRAFGITLNTMTLGGFAVAIGVVVDDAIIDVENIVRRLRENSLLEQPRSRSSVILDASVEVRGAIVYATLIVVAAFLPVFMLGGIQGKFFLPLGVAFVLATVASLGVAVTATPALCSLLLRNLGEEADPFYIQWLKAAHAAVLRTVAKMPKLAFLGAFLLLGGTAMLMPHLKSEFLPQFREGHFVLQFSSVPGTSLSEMSRLGKIISEELLSDSRVRSVVQQAGRSEQGVDTWGPERSEFHIELEPGKVSDEASMQDDIRTLVARFPGVQTEVLTFLGDRISETISGETAEIVVSVYGENLDNLEKAATQISAVISTVQGASDVVIQSGSLAPRLMIALRPDSLVEYGLRSTAVLDAIQSIYQGVEVAQVYEENEVIPIVVVGGGESVDLSMIDQLPIIESSGRLLRLSDIADVYPTSGRASIQHDGGRRRQVVTCNSIGRNVIDVVADAQKQVNSHVKLGKGMQVVFTGTAEAQAQAHRNLIASSSLAVILVVLLLWIVFRSGRNVTLVMVNLPFALVGGVIGLFLSGMPVSLGALVGMITLFGVSSRNAIMMLSHYEHLVRHEGAHWNVATAIRGSGERLIPVLMTAMVTGLALLPIALRPRAAGQEIEGPMAIVILGGLVTSTALTLILLPALALKFGKFEPLEPFRAQD